MEKKKNRDGDRDEKANHVINKCNKWAEKEYKPTYDWSGKEVHQELTKKLEFNLTYC